LELIQPFNATSKMKNAIINYQVAILIGLALLSSCKEVGPDINLGGNANAVSDTTYVESPVATPELKNVVIEEFTGVRCPNCPQGHQVIASIKASNPERIVAVSLHPINSLGAPYAFSVQDFKNQKAQSLFDYLGQIGLEPAAGIDRKLFSGESNILLDKNKWITCANQQLAQTSPVNLLLSKSYDSVSRELTMIVELHYTDTVPESNKLTLLLTESNIVTAQLDGSIIDTFYTHKDVMRDVITDITGDVITQSLGAGRVVRKVYKKVLDVVWKPENMHVVAYVHEYLNSKRIYQGKEIEVQ
jgi:hypothetical protein